MNTESMKNLDFILMTGSIYQILFTNDYQLTTNYFVRNYQRKMQNKPNSPNVQMSLTIFITMNYTNFISLVRQKNKPNSNPIKAKSNPIAEVTKMSVNIYYTKVYNNEAALRWKKQSQFKPNFKAKNEFHFANHLLRKRWQATSICSIRYSSIQIHIPCLALDIEPASP